MTPLVCTIRSAMNPSSPQSHSVALDMAEMPVAQPEKLLYPERSLTERTVGDYLSEADSSSTEDDEEEEEQQPPFQPLVQNEPPRARSILKASSEEIPVCSNRKSWKSLPEPNTIQVRAQVVTITEDDDESRRKRQLNVGFAQVCIREYDQTLGDNPSVSYGPPISLDWGYVERDPMCIDQYEAYRAPRRSLRQLCMNYYTRRNLLMWKYQVEEKEIKAATKQADKAKRGRAVTKYLLPYSKLEDFVTSAGRKAKRVVVKTKSANV